MDQEDDFFDDADLDELERNAIASTQHPSTAAALPATTSSDFDFEDGDVIDLDAPPAQPVRTAGAIDEVTAREQWRHQRFAQTTPGLNRAAAFQSARSHLKDPPTTSVPYRNSNSLQSQPGTADVNALQARIQELEDERIKLQQAADEAKSNALAKAGEIAIVRSNHDRASKEHDRKVAALQKQHADELAKQKSELDVVRRDREKAETDKRFLEHDLAQEAQRSKRNVTSKTLREAQGNVRKTAQDSPSTTPRKNRMLPLRDGFDDDEILVISPSKASRSKPSTPSKAGAKRKRPRADMNSPVQPLELDEGDVMQGVEGSFASRTEDAEFSLPLRTKKNTADQRYKFLQYILNHQAEGEETRTIEKFTTMKIPPDSTMTLASLVYEHFTTNEQTEQFREAFCMFLLESWNQCLQSSHYTPVFLLNRLLQDILTDAPPEVSIAVIVPLVQRCQTTADLVALPTVKHAKTPTANKAPSSQLKNQIDPYDQLELLMATALNVCDREDALTAFWQTMEFEIVLLLLNKAHPIAQTTLMLQLLETSILPTSFGTLDSQAQQQHETDTIDRLTVLLFEQPAAPADEAAYTAAEQLTLRRSVLALLKALCTTTHGGRALAAHKLAVGRLVRFLHEAVVALYAYRTETHALTAALVAAAVRLLAHLTSQHADVLDMRARLAVVPSGAQMHLVALSRLAFAECETGLEKLIPPDVAEAAHRMLDEHLSPEEGEAVVEVFSSAKG